MDSLTKFIGTVKQNLASSSNVYPNEASVSFQIVIPTLNHLGWRTTDPTIVIPEFSVKTLRVDYALVIPEISSAPKCIVEVKAVGKVDADEQLFEYAFHTGVPLAILTDGREWRVYLPMGHGSYRERLVRTFDFASGDEKDAANGLWELLSYENTASGESIKIANRMRTEREQIRVAKTKIRETWDELTTSKDAIFIDFLIEETSRICGFPPRRQDVVEFLNDLTQPPKPIVRSSHVKKPDKIPRTRETKLTTYWMFNKKYDAKNYTLAYVHIMETLAPRLTNESLNYLNFFYQQKSDITKSHRIRALPVLNGKWWIHTYTDSKTKFRQVEKTCKESSVTFRSKEGILLPDPNNQQR